MNLPCLFCQAPTKNKDTNTFWHYCDNHPLANQSAIRIVFSNLTYSLHLDLYQDELITTVYLRKPIPGRDKILELVSIYSETTTTVPEYPYLLSLLNRVDKLKSFL